MLNASFPVNSAKQEEGRGGVGRRVITRFFLNQSKSNEYQLSSLRGSNPFSLAAASKNCRMLCGSFQKTELAFTTRSVCKHKKNEERRGGDRKEIKDKAKTEIVRYPIDDFGYQHRWPQKLFV